MVVIIVIKLTIKKISQYMYSALKHSGITLTVRCFICTYQCTYNAQSDPIDDPLIGMNLSRLDRIGSKSKYFTRKAFSKCKNNVQKRH